MAQRRYADAIVSKLNVDYNFWMDSYRDIHEGLLKKNYVHRVAKKVLNKCDPKQYLLSHATIVASVDTYAPKGVKIGRQLNNGVQIDVRWPEFRIKSESVKYVNKNGECWDRPLLLTTYRTFVGAQNYLEHIQLPELSKGFIVDAVARDLGDTVYIDILVATDRKHKKLVSDILSGEVNSLSMGALSLFAICSVCGNVAPDDDKLCPCILYIGKSNVINIDGEDIKVAEIIGHHTVPNSNQFIEASWVKIPAFEGAVRRNFLNSDPNKLASMMQKADRVRRSRLIIETGSDATRSSVASYRIAEDTAPDDEEFDLPESSDDSGSDDSSSGSNFGSSDSDKKDDDKKDDDKKDDDKKDDDDKGNLTVESSDDVDKMMAKLADDIQKKIMESIMEKFGKILEPKTDDVGVVDAKQPLGVESLSTNDNLVASSKTKPVALNYNKLIASKFSNNPEFVDWAIGRRRQIALDIKKFGKERVMSNIPFKDIVLLSMVDDKVRGKKYSSYLYKLLMSTGPISNYPSERSFLNLCSLKLGRDLKPDEKNFLLQKGSIGGC